MSCLEQPYKPIVPLKTLDVIFRRRNVRNTQFYFTNRKHVVSETEKSKRSRPFNVPRSEKLLSYIKYSDRMEKLAASDLLARPLFLKDNFKIAAMRDLSKRLFIEEPSDDVRAVVEIHPEFYTVIEGRPLRCFDDIKVYINNIRSYAMDRQQIGYRRDIILRIDQSIVDENRKHDAIVQKLKEHINNFQKFITEDYKKACIKVAKAEKIYADLVTKNSEFLAYVSTLTIMNNIIFKLDAIRNVLKIYRRYLLFVAPISWRQQHDETLWGRVQSIQFEVGDFVTDDELIETLGIDKIVEAAKAEFKHPLPACIYFTTPEQMMYMFRTMELQSREYITQLAKTDVPFRILQERIKQLKQVTKQELDYFQYYIDNIKIQIQREIYNENYLQEKFFRLLNESFFDRVASPSTLKLKICVEYVYEQVFGKCEEGHQNIRDPMKILEVMYEEYNLKLDSLDFKVVNQARNEFFAEDLRMMRNAYKAQRELRAFREMTNAMNKAFLPPYKFNSSDMQKIFQKKSKNHISKDERMKSQELIGNRIKLKKYKLSAEEREALTLFTDWCEGMNPSSYLDEYYSYVKPTFELMARKSIDMP